MTFATEIQPGVTIAPKSPRSKTRRVVREVDRFCASPFVVLGYLHSDQTYQLPLSSVVRNWRVVA